MKGEKLHITNVVQDGTLADINVGDTFEVLHVWYDFLGDTRATIGQRYGKNNELVKNSHTVVVKDETIKFAPGTANINTVAGYEKV